MKQFPLPLRWLSLAAALALLACNGNIGSPGESSTGDNNGVGNNGVGNNGVGNNGVGNNGVGNNGNNGVGNNGNNGEPLDPGSVTLHRLNRTEYNNTVRDLLGTAQTPADDFPDDDHGYGFDNIANVLSISPLQLELYDTAAQSLVAEVLDIPVAGPGVWHFEAEQVGGSVGGESGSAWNLWSNGTSESVVDIPADGTYTFRARLWASQAGPELAMAAFTLNGLEVDRFDVPNTSNDPGVFEFTTTITAGPKSIGVAFLNDYYDPDAGEDRNLLVDWFELEGPEDAQTSDNPLRAGVVTCDPADIGDRACLAEIATDFGARAWRRPLTADEVDELVELYDIAEAEGDGFEEGLRMMVHAILISPHFIFRVELDPSPDDDTPHDLNDYELASRLSYFLWSSMPDQELFDLAARGELNDETVLREQVDRMITSDKADALVKNFAGQWLFIRAVKNHEPDYATYPEWNRQLLDAMEVETETLFREFMRSDEPLTGLLTANHTYVNDQLAGHYGLPAPGGGFARVDLTGTNRKGILTHGSILTITSFPTRTSPVKRGEWVLSNMLCAEIPDPPAGVEGLEESGGEGGSLREQLERHRADPVCSGCHNLMDPIGFGLENYNGVGQYRTDDNGTPVDASGQLVDGTEFEGALELADILAEDPRFAHCATEKLFTYALGRGPTSADHPYLQDITGQWLDNGMTFRELAAIIATSEPFRVRRAQIEEGN